MISEAVAAKQRPMLFSTPMVQALLAGTKTQTRRIVKDPFVSENQELVKQADGSFRWHIKGARLPFPRQIICPYGKPGDRIWVRETWSPDPDSANTSYRADTPNLWHDYPQYIKWRPSLFMPYAACRLFLEITDVRVERLDHIGQDDAIAEGIEVTESVMGFRTWRNYRHRKSDEVPSFLDPVNSYRSLWEVINGADSWSTNPWVWVVSFKRIDKPTN